MANTDPPDVRAVDESWKRVRLAQSQLASHVGQMAFQASEVCRKLAGNPSPGTTGQPVDPAVYCRAAQHDGTRTLLGIPPQGRVLGLATEPGALGHCGGVFAAIEQVVREVGPVHVLVFAEEAEMGVLDELAHQQGLAGCTLLITSEAMGPDLMAEVDILIWQGDPWKDGPSPLQAAHCLEIPVASLCTAEGLSRSDPRTRVHATLPLGSTPQIDVQVAALASQVAHWFNDPECVRAQVTAAREALLARLESTRIAGRDATS